MVDRLTEGKHAEEHVLWEAGGISREAIILAEGEDLEAGTVLEKSGDSTLNGKPVGVYIALATPGNAAAVLTRKTNATDADTATSAHVRNCEVVDQLLVWPDGISAGDKATAKAALAENMLIVRVADE